MSWHRVKIYEEPPLSEQLRTAETPERIRALLEAIANCPSVSSGTQRKCERAAQERIAELYAEAAK